MKLLSIHNTQAVAFMFNIVLSLINLESRQLARDREELEEIHRSRMDRIKAREESLLERLLAKEKVQSSNFIKPSRLTF